MPVSSWLMPSAQGRSLRCHNNSVAMVIINRKPSLHSPDYGKITPSFTASISLCKYTSPPWKALSTTICASSSIN